jgi:hypothetical protein
VVSKVSGYNTNHFKPKKFQHYLTVAELCDWLAEHGEGRHRSSIMKLEETGRIPLASRVQCGELEVRLWSPAQARKILQLLQTEIRPGRPPNHA